MKNYFACRISGTMRFPEGLAAGEDRTSNVISIARNGKGEPVLRGTSLCGALRASFLEKMGDGVTADWFGRALDRGNEQSQDSRIIVADSVLSGSAAEMRTHNMVNRHTGCVVEHGLFSLEALPPGTSGKLLLYVLAQNEEEAKSCLTALKGILASELFLGGNRNRGIGRLVCENLKLHCFNLENKDEFAKWIDTRYADRRGWSISGGESFDRKPSDDLLSLDIVFEIPQGEDLMVSDGATLDGLQGAPQYALKGKEKYWRIPGSTFRGIFRAWMSRLAVLDGKQLKYQGVEIKPELVGWAGEESGEKRKEYQQRPQEIGDPILDLFGSLYKRGRIHFSDAYSTNPAKDSDCQLRRHVAIDRFSGGANDGMLFSNKVLLSGVQFKMKLSLKQGTHDEKKWILKTLKAIDMGILSLGSNKASGLLSVKNLNDLAQELEG